MGLLLSHGANGASDGKHPVMDYGVNPRRSAKYQKGAQHLMAMQAYEVLKFVPPYGYVSSCECPSCNLGCGKKNHSAWSPDKPDQLRCPCCGKTLYPNPDYPENYVLKGKNALGEEIALPYYQNPKTGAKHFFSMHLWKYKREWLLAQCMAAAKAYAVTGNEDYARRLVLVLDRFAQVYPHYPALHNRSSRGVRFCESQQPPYNWDAGRWGYFHNEVPKPIIAIYDMIYDSPAFDELSAVRGYDVRRKLEDDFLRETYRIAASSPYHTGNTVGYDVAGIAMLGRVLGEPAYVQQAFGWMMDTLEKGFFRDGMWHESPSYHYMTIRGLRRGFDTLNGYMGPLGSLYPNGINQLVSPKTDNPIYARVLHAPEVLDFPNGCSTPVHDTWPGRKRSAPREQTQSTIAPAYGHASLGRGTGVNQMQAQLHFGGTYGHHHLDCLNLTLFAKEREMLPDLGYTRTQLRAWTSSTLAHNTVVIDRANQLRRRKVVDGNLLRYFPNASGISLVEAGGPNVYHGLKGPDAYRRLLLVVPVSEDNAYVVDIFRVNGGRIHDWALHGDADEDTNASCSLDLPARRGSLLDPGESLNEPQTVQDSYNPYSMVRDLRCGKTDKVFRTDFIYLNQPSRGVRVYLWANAAEVFLGRAPSVRRTRVRGQADRRKVYDFWMPQLIVRRQGEVPLRSTFAAVEEPYLGKPFIQRVERLPIGGGATGDIALRITHAGGVDTVISICDPESLTGPVTVEGIQFQGLCSVVRQRAIGGKVLSAHLFEAARLSAGGIRVTPKAPFYSGVIVGAERKLDGARDDCFILQGKLPEYSTLKGSWIIATYPGGQTSGHEIDHVEVKDGATRIVLARDHGLRIAGTHCKETHFPQRDFKGIIRFRIPLAECVETSG